MRKLQSKIAALLALLLLSGTILSGVGTQTAFAEMLNDIDYDPLIGEQVQVAPEFKLIPQSGETFAEGTLKFEITSPYVSSERLFIPDGKKVTLTDGSILEVRGDQILLEGVPIASLNSVENGQGKALKIDLSAPLANGNFEKPLLNGEVQDWTIHTTSTGPIGKPVNQVWLGPLAAKTQSTPQRVRAYSSFQSNGNGKYTATGPGNAYTYITDVNYANINRDGPGTVEGQETLLNSPGTLVKGLAKDNGKTYTGQSSLELGFKTGRIDQNSVKYGSVFRVDAWSTPFQAKAGDKLSFDWRAFTVPNDTSNYDDYEVYGFIVDQDGKHTEILYGRGKDQPWTNVMGTIPSDGTYQFRFVSGSFDETDGGILGATLRIDNARIISSHVIANVVDAIAQLVHYENSEYSGNRPVKITLVNGKGQQSAIADSDLTIKMRTKTEVASELEAALTVVTPANGAVLYDATQRTIAGTSIAGTTVSVTVTGPAGYQPVSKTISADENGQWSFKLANDLIKGGYTIKATAAKGGAVSNEKASTFSFVDKTPLEDYYNQVKNLNEADYQSGWADDSSDGDIEFAEALQAAKAVLEDVADPADGSHPDQALLDQTLAILQQAKAALEKWSPVETNPALFEHGKSQITIDFNKNVKLTSVNPAEGFVVTVDGTDYNIIRATAAGDKVILTVDKPLDSDANEVIVEYKTDGHTNLFGDEENGSADKPFRIHAVDDFGKALQIQTTKGNTDDKTPSFTGTVHSSATEVTLTIHDSKGSKVVTNGQAFLSGDGSWSYNVPAGNELVYGAYTYEVNAKSAATGKNVTKSAAFTVVNKTLLQQEANEVAGFIKDDYRAGWNEFEQVLEVARDVLADPRASQQEVDEVLAELVQKRAALEKHPPVATNPATYEHGKTQITVDFNKNVKLNDANPAEGFAVTVEKTNYEVDGAIVNGDKVTLTVAEPLDSDSKTVTVEYTPDSTPNLFGDEENGTAAEHFVITAKDEFGKGLQILATKGNTDDRTPLFTGQVHPDADRVTITIVNSGNKKFVSDATATLSGGTWIFDDWTGLQALDPGSYTAVVTATDADSGRSVTKSAAFTVVDKTALEDAATSAKLLKESNHRSGWDEFADALEEAEAVLQNPTASQAEVDQALAMILDKRDALEKIEPKPVNATFDHGHAEITVSFDKNVMFADGTQDVTEGFTVTVDGQEVSVIAAELVSPDADGKMNKVKLTMAAGTKLSSDAEVRVTYSKTAGSANLIGDEENGTAVEDFSFEAKDPFGHALQIDKPNGITNDTTPIIEGTVDAGAEHGVITITGPDGDQVIVDKAEITIQADGTWTYNVEEKLAPGEYTVEVSASKAGRPDVVKYHQFTVVDKQALVDLREDITNKDLGEGEYTKESWSVFKKAYNKAKEVIDDPEATQAEVNDALAKLKEAYEALVYTKDLKIEIGLSEDLEPSDYSKPSWDAYEKALKEAEEVVNNPKATQEEVDAAKEALENARKALTVDKSKLVEETDQSGGLKEKDYTSESWKAYQEALKKAKSVLADSKATQAEVDAAFKSLLQAKASLTKVQKDAPAPLPNTATNMFNWLLSAATIIVLGLALLWRRKEHIE
ncbi:Ig-like domain-containing protein [Neobacillus niacini]|uniref:Ig-like domain-containing protein n=1 Tax=Neobacillus niacini TaxID=86668 RepID=UPI0021CAE397|nr:Ig-like domain-containing protein [Neobacillus niacini]MCM3763719.1 Ig-like domain-containing protein [Neobacillus niacini]